MSKVISLKLLIDTKANKVVFAEASKEFVDFLFHIMSLPVATVIKLLGEKDMVGCLGLLYKSIESLNCDFLLANVNTSSILNPQAAVNVPLLALRAATTYSNKYYCCANHASFSGFHYSDNNNNKKCRNYVTDNSESLCPNCGCKMSTELSYVAPDDSAADTVSKSRDTTNGYVKGVVTYMVMDNLEVKPMSTISGITLLNNFQVMDIASLVEKEVPVSLTEGVAILKTALNTADVLTTVFLGKN